MKIHIMRFAPMDYRTSRVRSRSAVTADPMLRLVYLESLFALYENGGELPSDPEALADELMLPADEIARCLPLLDSLARRPGCRGGLLVEDGKVRNLRVSEDLGKAETFIAEQAERGRQSAAARRTKHGSAQPRGRSSDDEGDGAVPEPAPNQPPNGGSTAAEPPPNEASARPEPAVAVASAIAKPENNAPPGPLAAVENCRPPNGNGARTYAVGDRDPHGRTVLEVDGAGRPTVVRKEPAPKDHDAAVERLVEWGSSKLRYRFDRQQRRVLLERLKSGETEEQIRATWERTLAGLEVEPDEPVTGGSSDEQELDQALRLAGS